MVSYLQPAQLKNKSQVIYQATHCMNAGGLFIHLYGSGFLLKRSYWSAFRAWKAFYEDTPVFLTTSFLLQSSAICFITLVAPLSLFCSSWSKEEETTNMNTLFLPGKDSRCRQSTAVPTCSPTRCHCPKGPEEQQKDEH